MSSTIIRNVRILTVSRNPATASYYPRGEIRIDGNVVTEIGETVRPEADRIIDGEGMLAMPGLINGHNHFEQSFMNGTVRLYPGTTAEWIQEFKIPMTTRMDRRDYYLSAMLTCIHMIRSGVTSSISHICQQSAEKLSNYGVAETVRAIAESGVRAVVPIGLAGKNEPDEFIVTAEDYAAALRRWHDTWHGSSDGRVRIWPGPTGFYSSTPGMWEVAREFAAEKGCGIHTHLATFARGDVDQALEVGVLAPNFTGAHCVWLDTRDVAEMAAHNAKAVHNPTYKLGYSVDSSVKDFGDGIAPVTELVEAGCTVGLGQDGCMGDTQDLFKEMRNLAFTQHYRKRDKRLFPPSKLIEMVTVDAARTMMWDHEIGSLEPGKKADIILMDLQDPKFVPLLNIPASIVYQAAPENVRTVIIDGRVVMEDRRILTVDEWTFAAEAQEAAAGLLDRAGLGALTTRAFEPWASAYRLD
jgi:5-methylthioadenosine/S-adenosylhomocysteine deaminase